MIFLPQLWPRVSALFDEGIGLAGAQQAQWLAALELSEPACAAHVRGLLEAATSTSARDPLARPVAALRASALARALRGTALQAGAMLGPYRLVKLLGEGGMATVWLAEQTAGVLRRVALKIPHLGLEETQAAQQRFVQERDFLAALEHPHIARLYDAGVTGGGVPYLAMELVDGTPITRYCDTHQLSLLRRIELFRQALSAVGHAHARLVIHRDLKAANILVTPAGEVKLLDFGIARLLDDNAHPVAGVAEPRVFTPAAASPEQLQGLVLTTASDVYSLGVVLYELLTGCPPYQLDAGSPDLPAVLRAAQVVAPSACPFDTAAAAARGLGAPQLRRALAGDLDAIVAKAMHRSAAARYTSVAALADDLLRHRQGQPVQARPDTLGYRAGKFLRRYRMESAAGLLAAAMLSTVTVWALGQARQARLEADKAQAVKGFLLDLLTGADPGIAQGRPPQDVRVNELLDEARRSVADAFAAQPDVKSELLLTLGQAYETMGQYEHSRDTLRAALALPRGRDRAALEQRNRLNVQLASTLANMGQSDEVLQLLDEADQLFQRLGDNSSLSYAQAQELRGAQPFRRGIDTPFQEQALVLLERSAALYRSRYPEAKRRISVLRHLSEVYISQGRNDDSVRVGDEMVALALPALSTSPLQAATAFNQRAEARQSAGDLRGATDDYAQAAQLYHRVLGAEHLMTLRNQMELGDMLVRTGRADQGLSLLRELQQISQRKGMGPRWDAMASHWLGMSLLRHGQAQEAQTPLLEARARFAALSAEMGSATLRRSQTTLALATVRHRQGRHDEAHALLDEALAVRSRQQHRQRWPLSEVHLQLGLLALQRQRLDTARAQLDTALAQVAPEFTRGLAVRALAQAGLAEWALQSGHRDAALTASAAALETAALAPLRQDGLVEAAARAARGRVLCRYGDAVEGNAALARAVQVQAALVVPQDLQLAAYRAALGRCRKDTVRTADARVALRPARDPP